MRDTLNIFQHCIRKMLVRWRGCDKAKAMFNTFNFVPGAGPVILSVPHAGRVYDSALIDQLRVPLNAILPLEDRYADRLTEAAAMAGFPTIIAQTPRLAIDLNRAPDDLDPVSIRGGFAGGLPTSAKARAGLGLIPTRLWGVGALWRAPFERAGIDARLRTIHAPYHAAIADALAAARRHWSSAILIDLHSMPPINDDNAPDIVIGDRFGTSASSQLAAAAESVFKAAGLRVAINAPYAGGYIVSRHARPHAGVHALQVEVDRRLYLDAALDLPSDGLARVQKLVRLLAESLREELLPRVAAAAE
jgi:N-formylglutamate amidohydrolase